MYFVYNKSWHQKKIVKGRFFSKFIFIILLMLGLYFLYFGLYGNRGYIALTALSKEYHEKKMALSFLKKEERELENSISLLDGDMLDLDFLEEKARVILNYSKNDEAIIDFNEEE